MSGGAACPQAAGSKQTEIPKVSADVLKAAWGQAAPPTGSVHRRLADHERALAAFVRASRSRLVRFLLVRETGETDSTGLVHDFASKEHPTARPPTLRLC